MAYVKIAARPGFSLCQLNYRQDKQQGLANPVRFAKGLRFLSLTGGCRLMCLQLSVVKQQAGKRFAIMIVDAYAGNTGVGDMNSEHVFRWGLQYMS